MATLRCIGLGECRKHDTGSMCPSYMVTLEEQHSTRGRAHMLFELLQGEVVRDGWKDEHVKHALDLCLSCKACKSECPSNVDIATQFSQLIVAQQAYSANAKVMSTADQMIQSLLQVVQ